MLRVILVAGSCLFLCEGLEYAIVRRHEGSAYPPKIGWRLARWVAIALGILVIAERFFEGHQSQPKDAPLWVGFCFLLLGAIWPRTVLVSTNGVSSCSTFGLRKRAIRWDDVVTVDSDWEEVRSRGFTFMGTRVYVVSRTGTRINHGIVQGHQQQFFDELRKYVPQKLFAPGLYDWKP